MASAGVKEEASSPQPSTPPVMASAGVKEEASSPQPSTPHPGIPSVAMEAAKEAMDEAAATSTVTHKRQHDAEDPSCGVSRTQELAAASVLQHHVRPRHRARRQLQESDTLTTASSLLARSLEQGNEMVQAFWAIQHSLTRFAVAKERIAAALEAIQCSLADVVREGRQQEE